MNNNWLVYLLECKDKSYYCGITNNLCKRVAKHNAGKGAKYTKPRLPVRVVAICDGLNKGEALSLEYKIKQLKRDQKIDFMNNLP